MPSRSTFVPVRVASPFWKIRAWEEWRRGGRRICTSARFTKGREFCQRRVHGTGGLFVPSRTTNFFLIIHRRRSFEVPSCLFRIYLPIVERKDPADRVFPLERDLSSLRDSARPLDAVYAVGCSSGKGTISRAAVANRRRFWPSSCFAVSYGRVGRSLLE